ncbi:MAG: hypothetical protein GTO54_08605, partial [Nitrososphaeria archaeon]|nr:hypothetical protein [Nitrososphaeria archaeon]NIN53055.1 hypothetical protein [Nitrososphaeria archaeon]
ICMSCQDLIKKMDMVRMCSQRTTCILRCTGGEALNAFSIATYEIDQKRGTDYYKRFNEFAKNFQENDLTAAQGMTDVRGDRSLKPHQQPDPDMYLRVVDERSDGIVVRGAKAHISGAPVMHEIFVMPSRTMRKEDRDFAVAFVVPSDAKGLTHVVNTTFREEGKEDDHPFSSKYSSAESFLFFDDVFIPEERVFMCGEHEFSRRLVLAFSTPHRHSRLACSSGITDILTGASALAAEYNGIQNVSHIRDKINELLLMSESYYALGISAATLASKTASGTYMPNILHTNVGKVMTARGLHEAIRLTQDVAGGLVQTVPSSKTYQNKALAERLDKYLKAKDTVPTQHRVRLFRFLQDLTTYGWAGFWLVVSAVGAGSPYGAKLIASREVDLEEKKKLIKRLCGIQE